MPVMEETRLLVTGASGGLARSVIANLLEVYDVAPGRIIAVSRNPDRIADLAERGIETRRGGFDDPQDDLAECFAGADRLLLISVGADPLDSYLADTELAGDPDRRRVLRQINAVNAARQAGVGHILYTSAPNPEPPTMCFWKRDHWHTECAIRDSGLEWSILRMWEYPDFHLTFSWAQALGSGEFLAGSGDGRCAFIARDDCARAAAAALVMGDAGRAYDITGNAALTIDEIMALLARVNHRQVDVRHVSPAELLKELENRGEDLAPVFAAFQEGVREGKYDRVSDDFRELTGQAPNSLEHFLVGHPVSEEDMEVMFSFADHPVE